jgi:hypothetical protein
MTETTQDQTPTVGKLADALAKAQGAMDAAKKDAVNPHFGSKYANLAAVWEAIRGPLAANGLAVVQMSTSDANGVTVTTQLLHSSGEWIRDRLSLPVVQKTPQGFGSALTYARRYSLAAMVGVAAEEDDDGNAASAKPQPPKQTAKPKPPLEEARKAAGAITSSEMAKVSPPPIPPWKRVADAGAGYNYDSAAISNCMEKVRPGKKGKDLTPEDADAVIRYMAELDEPPEQTRDSGGGAKGVASPRRVQPVGPPMSAREKNNDLNGDASDSF